MVTHVPRNRKIVQVIWRERYAVIYINVKYLKVQDSGSDKNVLTEMTIIKLEPICIYMTSLRLYPYGSGRPLSQLQFRVNVSMILQHSTLLNEMTIQYLF